MFDPTRARRQHDAMQRRLADAGLAAPVSAERPDDVIDAADALRTGLAALPPHRFVRVAAAEALRHRAVRHPYLLALAEGTLPDLRWALRDFATQYYGYSRHFPRYLATVVARLERAEHRAALLQNLTEESGVYDDDELADLARVGVRPAWIVGVPHPALFARFAEAMGVDPTSGPESDQVVCWREMLLDVLGNGTPAEAVGALGMGTEGIVSTMYVPFVRSLARYGEVSLRDGVFFTLHTAVDDHHQESLQRIAEHFAQTPDGRRGLRRGMLKALHLRSAFWDWLHARALDPSAAATVP